MNIRFVHVKMFFCFKKLGAACKGAFKSQVVFQVQRLNVLSYFTFWEKWSWTEFAMKSFKSLMNSQLMSLEICSRDDPNLTNAALKCPWTMLFNVSLWRAYKFEILIKINSRLNICCPHLLLPSSWYHFLLWPPAFSVELCLEVSNSEWVDEHFEPSSSLVDA